MNKLLTDLYKITFIKKRAVAITLVLLLVVASLTLLYSIFMVNKIIYANMAPLISFTTDNGIPYNDMHAKVDSVKKDFVQIIIVDSDDNAYLYKGNTYIYRGRDIINSDEILTPYQDATVKLGDVVTIHGNQYTVVGQTDLPFKILDKSQITSSTPIIAIFATATNYTKLEKLSKDISSSLGMHYEYESESVIKMLFSNGIFIAILFLGVLSLAALTLGYYYIFNSLSSCFGIFRFLGLKKDKLIDLMLIYDLLLQFVVLTVGNLLYCMLEYTIFNSATGRLLPLEYHLPFYMYLLVDFILAMISVLFALPIINKILSKEVDIVYEA